MKDALRRAARTFLQSFLGVFLLSFPVGSALPSEDMFQRVVIAAAFAGFIAVLSWLQNALEETTGHATPIVGK